MARISGTRRPGGEPFSPKGGNKVSPKLEQIYQRTKDIAQHLEIQKYVGKMDGYSPGAVDTSCADKTSTVYQKFHP